MVDESANVQVQHFYNNSKLCLPWRNWLHIKLVIGSSFSGGKEIKECIQASRYPSWGRLGICKIPTTNGVGAKQNKF